MVDQTPALNAVIDELEQRLGSGRYSGMRTPQVIRPIIDGGKQRPDLGYSQHSYRNASDIYAYGVAKQKPILDELNRMKQAGFPVGTILHAGNDSDHIDHIHVEGTPKVKGDPKKPDTWNIAGGAGEHMTGGGKRTGTKNADSATLEDLNWWDYIINPGKVEEAAGNLIKQSLLRIVFGIVALFALGATVWVIVLAFKGDDIKEIAGTALGAAIPG